MYEFDTIAEAERGSRHILPRSVYLSTQAGNEKGLTASANVAAYDALGFMPRLLAAREVDLATTVMGQRLSFPVLIAPTGGRAVHPDQELAVARAAKAADTSIALSIFATKRLSEVAAANEKTLFQLYWLQGRREMAERVERAREAGAAGLIITLDWSLSMRHDWGRIHVPARLGVTEMLRFAPEVFSRPRWLAQVALARKLPVLTVPNVVGSGVPVPSLLDAFGMLARTPTPTWDDIAWLRRQWDGPFMVKGITRVTDARRAVDAGATAISVSNHGGNNLDGTPASLRALPAVADAVGDDVEVLLDGGIRRGSDVVKALALGARAVMIGRPYLWGLAVGGQHGVHRVLEILRDGMSVTMSKIGRARPYELSRGDLIATQGFFPGVTDDLHDG